jgi:predicted regulator of Ras-like GTPase activity (Roadblock/LC7/MglB family)
MQLSAHVEDRVSKCEDILSRNPESLVFAALADAYRRKGDLVKAFHVCSQGLKLHPDYGPGHVVMARINMERGMYSEAERELALAQEVLGETRATELLLAQVLAKKGQLQEATRLLEKLRDADPENLTVEEHLKSIRQEADSGRESPDLITTQDRWKIAKVADLKDGLHYLKSLPGVLGALLVTDEGLVVESKVNPNLEDQPVGKITADIVKCVKDGISNIGFGEQQRIRIDAARLSLWITRFNQQALVLCYAPEANFGALRIRVSELVDHLSNCPQ